MNKAFIKDYERFTPNKYALLPFLIRYFRNHELRYIYWGRVKASSHNPIYRSIACILLRRYRRIYGLEINFKNVGNGLRLIHPWCITVNDNAVIGENATIFKGATIGVIEQGNKSGNPIIGNNVTIYANATICGNVHVGDNAVFAAGSFANFDVPDGAVVIGNPGEIHMRK